MHKQMITFSIEKTNSGAIKSIGRSIIGQPKTNFSGGSVKWYEDKLKSSK